MFKKKRVLIVGGGSSVGKAVIDNFVKAGADVIVTVHHNHPVWLTNSQFSNYTLDLSNDNSISAFASQKIFFDSPIDIIVFLAGLLPAKPLDDYNYELINSVMAVNFTGPSELLRMLHPHMGMNSHVIFVTSVSGERGSYDPIYGASKAAQMGLVKSLAKWWAPNTRFNAISPALIADTEMSSKMSSRDQEKVIENTPTNRLTTIEQLGGIIFALCTPSFSNVNGHILRVNGGGYI